MWMEKAKKKLANPSDILAICITVNNLLSDTGENRLTKSQKKVDVLKEFRSSLLNSLAYKNPTIFQTLDFRPLGVDAMDQLIKLLALTIAAPKDSETAVTQGNSFGKFMEGILDSVLNFETRFTDCAVLVEGVKIYAHRCVLCARSEFFRAAFNSSFQESKSGIITVDKFSLKSFQILLFFIYTGELPQHVKDKSLKLDEEFEKIFL